MDRGAQQATVQRVAESDTTEVTQHEVTLVWCRVITQQVLQHVLKFKILKLLEVSNWEVNESFS